jgi:hypothetical protein
MKQTIRRLLFSVGFGGAVIVLVAVLATDKALGREVLMIAPHKSSLVELNRMLYEQGEPIPELYGNPLSESTRLILPQEDRLVRPAEDPSLLLYKVEKSRGENPLQAQTLWFFTKFAVPALGLLGLLGFAIPRRRSA